MVKGRADCLEQALRCCMKQWGLLPDGKVVVGVRCLVINKKSASHGMDRAVSQDHVRARSHRSEVLFPHLFRGSARMEITPLPGSLLGVVR